MAHGTHHRNLTAEEVAIPPGHKLRLVTPIGLGVGAVGLAATFLLGGGEGRHGGFFGPYLVAFLFWLSLALGGLFFVLVQHASRAGWSVVVRRLAEHVAGTLPLFALLFVPLAFGVHDLYHWSHAEAVADDPILQGKSGWLDEGFFLARAAVYLVLWALTAWWFRRRSLAQDRTADPKITRRLQSLSAPMIAVFALTVTFAAFDWIMSLDPHWFSTIFGVYFFAGAAVGIFALLALLSIVLDRPLAGAVTPEHLHDLGKLLFAFVVFWAYIAFSQFLLIWYANLPEETVWFQHRMEGGWEPVTLALAVAHFGIPFFFLLPRGVKRRRAPLAAASLWLLAVHYLDLYWLVMPALHPEGPVFGLAEVASFVGVGGLFLGALGWLLARPALVPVGDPRLPESLSFENM